jgi:hypothetical protein
MKNTAKPTPNVFDTALRAFAALDLEAWHGLPERCPVHEARRVFGLDDAIEGRATLGAKGKPASFQSLDDRPLRIWQRGGAVVLLDYEGPFEALHLDRLLGPPARRNAAHWGYAVLPEGEWLYPQRGLAAIVLPTGVIARLFGFAPVADERFAETLRPCTANRPSTEGRLHMILKSKPGSVPSMHQTTVNITTADEIL